MQLVFKNLIWFPTWWRSLCVPSMFLSRGTQSEQFDWFETSKRRGKVQLDLTFQRSLIADIVKKKQKNNRRSAAWRTGVQKQKSCKREEEKCQ